MLNVECRILKWDSPTTAGTPRVDRAAMLSCVCGGFPSTFRIQHSTFDIFPGVSRRAADQAEAAALGEGFDADDGVGHGLTAKHAEDAKWKDGR
jgi:hypothetical protein